MNLPCLMLFKGFRLKMMWECFAVGDPIRSNQTHTFAAVGCAPHHSRYLASGPCGRCVHSMFLCIYRTCFLCQGCTSIQRLACRPYVKKRFDMFRLILWGQWCSRLSILPSHARRTGRQTVLYSTGSVHVFTRFVRDLPLARCRRLVQSSLQPRRPGTFIVKRHSA